MQEPDCQCPARGSEPCPLSKMECSYRRYAVRRLSYSVLVETDDATEMGFRAALRRVLATTVGEQPVTRQGGEE
jgi:hypothetical protein